MEEFTNQHGLHTYDTRWEGRRTEELPFHTQFLAQSLVDTARTWATLHPSASHETRERLVAAVAEVLGVALVIG